VSHPYRARETVRCRWTEVDGCKRLRRDLCPWASLRA
jgi:hypothetical protein